MVAIAAFSIFPIYSIATDATTVPDAHPIPIPARIRFLAIVSVTGNIEFQLHHTDSVLSGISRLDNFS